MKINKRLAIEAKKHNICDNWFNDILKANDKDKMIEIYLKGIDFCLLNDYPTRPFIQKHFSKEIMNKYNIFLDEKIEAQNTQNIVILGNSSGTVEYAGYEVGQVFVSHEAKLTVIASDNSFVMVSTFGKCEVDVIASNDAKVCVFYYAGKLTTATGSEQGNAVIKVIHKHSKTN